ncbi:MAG: AMP-binding protein [Spirochaetota bacterium]
MSVLVSDLFFNTWGAHPELPALGYAGEEAWTYRDAASLIAGLAGRIRDSLAPNARAVILSENMPTWGIAYLAVNRAGAVVVPVLPDFPAGDIASIVSHAEPAAVFVSRRLAARALEAGIDASTVSLFLLENLEPIDALDAETVEASLAIRPKPRVIPDAPNERDRPDRDPDDLAAIIYTSGTTGHSKGVMLSNRNLVYDVEKTRPIPGIRPGDALLSILPLAHTYECTIGFLIPISTGCSISYLRRPPSATVLMPALHAVRPHLMLSVPLLIEKLYRQSVLPSIRGKRLSRWLYRRSVGRKLLNRLAGRKLRRAFGGRLYFFGIGGAGIDPEVEDFLVEANFPYAVGYGLTETSPLIAGANNRSMRPRSTGFPIEGVEVRLADPNPETGEGEILVRGPIVMQGYYKDPERTAEVIDSEGWFHTGDLGSFDDDGRLYIRGRVKNMILGPSGENIFPEAIESVINSFDYVEESVVFQYQGELMARVHVNYEALREQWQSISDAASGVPKSVSDYLADLRTRVNQRLAAFARIGDVIEQDEPFEKTPTNKIKRFLYDRLHPEARNRSDEDDTER